MFAENAVIYEYIPSATTLQGLLYQQYTYARMLRAHDAQGKENLLLAEYYKRLVAAQFLTGAKGYVNTDLKPDNVLIDSRIIDEGESYAEAMRIIDFGMLEPLDALDPQRFEEFTVNFLFQKQSLNPANAAVFKLFADGHVKDKDVESTESFINFLAKLINSSESLKTRVLQIQFPDSHQAQSLFENLIAVL